jgi:hypothetical protein
LIRASASTYFLLALHLESFAHTPRLSRFELDAYYQLVSKQLDDPFAMTSQDDDEQIQPDCLFGCPRARLAHEHSTIALETAAAYEHHEH